MKIYDFFVKQFKVKNITDALILLLKLFVIAIIADEIYNTVHMLPCLQTLRDKTSDTFFYCLKQTLFFLIIYVIYRLAKRFKRKGTLKRAVIISIILSVLIYWFNGSLLGIYYFGGPYWGKVVDADTGEPIAGANVMAKWVMEEMAPVAVSPEYADARETVTDDEGRFFVTPARRIWLWPFSWMYLENLYVYKPGYDSHPPYIQRAWNVADKEKWKLKLNKLFPGYNPTSIKDEEYFSDLRYVPGRYHSRYRVEGKIYKPTIIKLNRALSNEEKKKAVTSFGFSDFSEMNCNKFKIKKFKEIIRKGRRQWLHSE